MKYYKDTNNKAWAYEDNVKPEQIKAGLTAISDTEFNEITNPPPTQEQLDATAKQAKQEALATITVTTLAGNTFDGHDEARNNMLSALREGDASNETETPFWILTDNSLLTPCTYAELEEAHGLAIRAKGAILAGV